MLSLWNLYFPAYLIYDGWGHIHVGQELNTPGVQFGSVHPLRKTVGGKKSANSVPGFGYVVEAEVLFNSGDGCVLDFGLRAVGASNLLPEGMSVGDYVTGEVGVSVDQSAALPPKGEGLAPAYNWQVDGITADLTPYIEHPDPAFNRALIRDDSRTRYEEVSSTVVVLQREMKIPTTSNLQVGFYLRCQLKTGLTALNSDCVAKPETYVPVRTWESTALIRPYEFFERSNPKVHPMLLRNFAVNQDGPDFASEFSSFSLNRGAVG